MKIISVKQVRNSIKKKYFAKIIFVKKVRNSTKEKYFEDDISEKKQEIRSRKTVFL